MIIFSRLFAFQKAVISGASDADFHCEDILISEQQRKSCCRLCLFGEFVKMNPSPVPQGFCLWQKKGEVFSEREEKRQSREKENVNFLSNDAPQPVTLYFKGFYDLFYFQNSIFLGKYTL